MADDPKTPVKNPPAPARPKKVDPFAGLDLTKEEDVLKLLRPARSSVEWNMKVEKVREANGGDVPDFWKEAIIDSGFAREVSLKWDFI